MVHFFRKQECKKIRMTQNSTGKARMVADEDKINLQELTWNTLPLYKMILLKIKLKESLCIKGYC